MRAENPLAGTYLGFSRRRISRSLVTVGVLALFNSFLLPSSYLPPASAVILTTGTCTVDGTNMTTSNIIDNTASDGTCTIRLTSGTASFLVPPGLNSVAAMVVGGGGGGGFGGNGGGGGAGAVIVSNSGVAVSSGTTISGTVGGGGTTGWDASQSNWTKGGKGTDSSVTINTLPFVASGGGGGSAWGNAADNGGSGGGKAINGTGPGSGYNLDYAGWTQYVNSGSTHSTVGGGGGGGAGGAPATASSNGGIGVTVWGYSVGGGGSGWSGGSATAAAPFGGGAPRTGTAADGCNSCNGTANTGGGGGGGGAGGSGVIVIKYLPSRGQGTIAQTNGFQINRKSTFTFTRTGTAPASTTASFQWQVRPSGSSTWSNVSTGTGGTTTTYQTGDLTQSDNGNTYRIAVTDSSSTFGISTTTYTEVSAQNLFVPPGSDTDTALALTATSQYAILSSSTVLPTAPASPFTFQAWVNPSDAGVDDVIFSQGTANNFFIKRSGGNLQWRRAAVAAGAQFDCGAFPTGSWSHVALTWNGAGTASCYINGVLTLNSTSLSVGTTNLNSPAVIGQFSNGLTGPNTAFNGQIDELKIWSSVRTAEQIATDMNSYASISDASLIAYYDFNEGSGTTIYNRKSGATTATDFAINSTPGWTDVKIVDSVTQSAYTTITFPRSYITSNNGWRVPTGVTRVSALVVAGGGGGGNGWDNAGGGGGGGGMVLTSLQTFTPNQIATVTVGNGGRGSISTRVDVIPNPGQNTVFDNVVALGGGVGNPGRTYAAATPRLGGNAQIGSTSAPTGGSGGGSSGGGGGGGGATAAGSNASGGTGGTGGTGLSSDISGSTTTYGSGGRGSNGSTNTTGVAGSANTGGGGGGGGGASSNSGAGGDGGSGVIIVRYITALKPIFTQPTNDTTTAGLTDTITVSNNPISPLLRNFQWQRSIDTGTTWSNITTGSGITSNTYTTPILDTSTSGSRFQYRVIVTDSDTAGLFIVDTSTAVFIVINPPIVISGTYTVQKYGQTHTDTFTAVNGTGTGNKTFTFTPNRAGLTWNGATANQATLTVASTLGPGTYLETMTATDTRGAQTSLAISVVVTKADTVTVTTLALTDTYTGSALTFTPRFTVTGLLNSDTVTPITWNYQGADNAGTSYGSSPTRPMNAGSYTISGSAPLALIDSYTAVRVDTATLTINRATRTISMGAVASPIKYGDTRTATATPSLGAGDGVITFATTTSDSCTVTSTTIRAVKPSGTCSFTATIARGNNFESATSTSPVTATLSRADTLTVRVSNPVTLTFTGSAAPTLPTVTLVGLAHTDTGTVTRLYSAPASLPGAPETYTALVDSPSTPVDVESYTVGASFAFSSGASSNYLNVVVETSTLRINQANQDPLRIALYNAWVGSPFTILTEGGNGLGAVVETITAGSTATDCRISARVLTMTSTTASSCNILVTKAATRNYRAETATATINFLILVINQPSPPPGSGPNIALAGENDVSVDLVGAPTITAISPSVISLSAGGSLTISGTGFGTAPVTVKFWRDKSVTITPTNGSTIVVPVSSIAAANGQSGRVLVINVGGTAVSVERLTINP